MFVVDSVPENLIPRHIKEYQEKTGWKQSKEIRSLLYAPLLKWYLCHGLIVTEIYKYLRYKASKPFSWFLEEVSKVKRDGDSNPALKKLGDTKSYTEIHSRGS